jgi:transposase
MAYYTRFYGLDVHKDSISIAVALRDGPPAEFVSRIINRNERVLQWLKRELTDPMVAAQSLFCYEAGPCGYELYRFLRDRGIACEVIAPGMTPRKPNERNKTDRLDAIKLATYLRSGHLTPIWVPDEQHEAFRRLLRVRRCIVQDRTRCRHRLSKLLLATGRHAPDKVNNWTQRHQQWLNSLTWEQPEDQMIFEEMRYQLQEVTSRLERLDAAIAKRVEEHPLKAAIEAVQCLKGFALVTAATVCAEIGDIRRFEKPTHLMGYSGLVPGVHQSGGTTRQTGITKAGNAHLRAVLVEAAWAYRYAPRVGVALAKRQQGQSAAVIEASYRAQVRLHNRYRHFMSQGKHRNQAVTAVAKESLGFVWEVLMIVSASSQPSLAA